MAEDKSTRSNCRYKLSITARQRREIAASYAAGESSASLAEKWKTSPVTIRKIVTACGVSLKSREQINKDRKLFSEEDEKAIVDACVGGEQCRSVADRYACSYTAIYYILKRHGVTIVNRRYKTTPEQRDEIAKRYLAGESPTLLAREFGLDPSSIKDIRENRGVATIYPTGTPKKYTCDESAFDDLSLPDAQYWAGLLMADGCNMVREGRREHSVKLSLSAEDGHHLESLRTFLQSDSPVVWKSYASHRCPGNPDGKRAIFTVYSQRLSESLSKCGVVPRKSLTAEFRLGLERSRHAWRGVMDGDGWISITGRGEVQSGVCGSPAIVSQFKAFVDRSVGASRGTVEMAGADHARYRVHGDLACNLVRLLYGCGAVALPSKRDRANNIIRHWQGGTL